MSNVINIIKIVELYIHFIKIDKNISLMKNSFLTMFSKHVHNNLINKP